MNHNINLRKIVKTVYHFLAFIFLLYLGLYLIKTSVVIRIILVIFAVFHLYDTWWFLNYDSNAPI